MEGLEKKLIYFQKIVEQEAIEEKRKIEQEVYRKKEEKMEVEKKRIQKESEQRIEEERCRLEKECKQQISKEVYEQKKELLKKRDEIMTSLLQNISKKLEQFCKSEAYKQHLFSLVESAVKNFGSEMLTVYFKPEDQPVIDFIKKQDAYKKMEWIEDSSILLGGFILKKKGSNRIADETFDEKLREAQEKFLTESDLSLEGI